jgi:hypothetical protein
MTFIEPVGRVRWLGRTDSVKPQFAACVIPHHRSTRLAPFSHSAGGLQVLAENRKFRQIANWGK